MTQTSAQSEPMLGIVVITRNEARHIAASLDAALNASRQFPDTEIILVDSESTDATVAIAARYPISIYRYRGPIHTAAAGRRIGFERIAARYVLFVDGDCRVEASWLSNAISMMEADPQAAIAYGARQEVFEGVTSQFNSVGPSPEEYGLGGNALYRTEILRQVDSFNPYIVAEEEGELLARIQAAGYHAIRTSDVIFTHYTLPKDSIQGVIRRHLRGLSRGRGQVLRVSIRQGLFAYHARRFNRYLLMLAYLALGVVLAIVGAVRMDAAPPLLWVALGFAAFIWLWFRRRSARSALYIVMDWTLVGITMARDFLQSPGRPEMFKPLVERMK